MKRAVLLLASLAFALVLAEVFLRAVGFSHPVFARADSLTGFAHIPGAKGWYAAEGRGYVRINADGWRGQDRPFSKPAGVTRIAVLGDSYTEAFQVPEDSSFPSRLERDLNNTRPGRYEVLNFGVSGYGTAQELLVFRHRALAYAPDAVILAFTTGNDVSDNSRALRQLDYVPYFKLVDQRVVLDTSFLTSRGFRSRTGRRAHTMAFLVRHFRLAQLFRVGRIAAREVTLRPERLAREVSDDLYRDPPADSTWAEAWTVTESLITRIHLECRARHIPFYLVTLSNPEQVTPDQSRQRARAAEVGLPDLFQPERRLKRLGIREGFDVLALAPLLSAQAIVNHEYYHGIGKYEGLGHWNERGHGAAATVLSTWLAGRITRGEVE